MARKLLIKRPKGKTYRNFWVDLAQTQEAKTREQLVDLITLKLKDFDANYLQTIIKHVKTNLINIADGSINATFKKHFFIGK